MKQLFALALFVPFTLNAQVVTSVQNGFWTAPTTWSCNCVPTAANTVLVEHSVELSGNTVFDHPQLNVSTGGEIHMAFPADVTFAGGIVVMEGHMLLIGEIDNAGALITVSGFFEAIGQFNNDGDLFMDQGLMQVEGDLSNFDSIDGDGAICVYDTTDISGSITGTVDICDGTPTTATPPIVDVNTGSIAGTVTYCQSGQCAWSGSVGEGAGAAPMLVPVPSDGPVAVIGLPAGDQAIVVRDAIGRAILTLRSNGSRRVDIPCLPPGAFTVEVVSNSARTVLRGLVSAAPSQ